MHEITKRQYLSKAELVTLHETFGYLREREPQRVACLEFLLLTGARVGEALAITLQDLDTSDETVFVRASKGGQDRSIPLPADFFSLLLKMAPETGPIFPHAIRTMQKFWHKVRPCRKKLHSLRHTLAINILVKHRDINLVKVVLGHRQLSSTFCYSNYLFSNAQIRKALVG